jgi:hypothetical protein
MPDIIGITEPLLTNAVPDVQILLPSYHPLFVKDHPKSGHRTLHSHFWIDFHQLKMTSCG